MPRSPALAHKALSAIERSPLFFAVLIIGLSFAVRLWFVASGQINLSQDEAQYWDWSRRLQLSYYSKGPLIAWLIAFFSSIFGNSELGVRIGAVLLSTVAQIVLYAGVAKLFARPVLAVLCLFVANTMPLFMAGSLLMTTDNPLLLCWLAALLALYVAARPGKPAKALFVMGAAMAVGCLAKYMMLAFFGVAILYLLLLRRHGLLPGGRFRAVLLVLGFGAIIGNAPILVWNIQNGWVGFLHVGSLAGVTGSKAANLLRFDTLPEFLGGQFGIATPWWMLLLLFSGWRCARQAWNGTPAQNDPLRNLPRGDQVRQCALLACAFWPLWLALLVWSLHTRIYPNWAGMSFVGGIILAAAGLERLLSGFGTPRACRFAPLWPILGGLVFILIFGQQWLLPLPPQLNPTARLKGWEDVGHEAARLAATLPNPEKVFYFSSGYDVTAELAFYVPGQPVAYSADFGRRRSQYDLWPGPEDKTGWNAVFVTTDNALPEQLKAMFAEVTAITYASSHKGRPGKTFTIGLLRNFNGFWPRTEHASY